jgi:hypothetical protein
MIKLHGERVLEDSNEIEVKGDYDTSRISRIIPEILGNKWVISAYLFHRSWFCRIWIV